MENNINKKIYEILSNILEIKVDRSTNISMIECPKWTSLAHVDIIMSLEEEFDITFDEKILSKLNTQQKIIETIKGLINA